MKCLSITEAQDQSKKFLFQLADGLKIESVLLPRNLKTKKKLTLWPSQAGTHEPSPRVTLCVSSQVGCSMGCKFCVTGALGLMRNLTKDEILDQIRYSEKNSQQKITNIVFMGMGEPLHNAESVIQAIEALKGHEFQLSRRKITVSTSGLVPKIKELIPTRVNLAISLNATTNETRSKIMPVNRAYPLEELLQAAKEYSQKTSTTVMLEYVLLAGINDSREDASRLVEISRGWKCKVNLIPYNADSTGTLKAQQDLVRPSESVVKNFQHQLVSQGITTTVRYSGGDDVGAACGQLAAKNLTLSEIQK